MTENYFTKKNEMTLHQIDSLGRQILQQHQICEAVICKLKAEESILESMKREMLEVLETHGRTSHHIPGLGKFQMRERTSVTLPKTPEAKQEFFNYLKERGLFEHLVTVNSMTLNAFFKEERQIAIEEGRSMGFKIPGIDEPKTMSTLSILKG